MGKNNRFFNSRIALLFPEKWARQTTAKKKDWLRLGFLQALVTADLEAGNRSKAMQRLRVPPLNEQVRL